MKYYSQLTQNHAKQDCFGSCMVPEAVDNEVTRLIAITGEDIPAMNRQLLHRAMEISREYPTFICAQYALASAILNGKGPYDEATPALSRAWNAGSTALIRRRVVDVYYSASQGNASFLNAGATLARQRIASSDLLTALSMVNRVIRWDVEAGTDARFVKAHIEQLMGDQAAVASLHHVATTQDARAYYALGLEYLRRNKANDAVRSFQEGLKAAPEVAELLLGLKLPHTDVKRREGASVHHYVETFCLSEWTASELGALEKVVNKTVDSKW